MTLTEIIESFKTKLNPSKIMNSLEKAAVSTMNQTMIPRGMIQGKI